MEITLDTLINLLGLLLGGGCGAFFTWRWQQRKVAAEAKEKEAEAKSAEVDMAQKVQDTYQEMLEYKQKEVEDNHRYISELKADRDHYRQIVSEMARRQEETDAKVRDLQVQVARNGRLVESMRPFQCYDLKCRKRVRAQISECEEADTTATDDTKPKPNDIEPNNEL
jgi:hypothetical protein